MASENSSTIRCFAREPMNQLSWAMDTTLWCIRCGPSCVSRTQMLNTNKAQVLNPSKPATLFSKFYDNWSMHAGIDMNTMSLWANGARHMSCSGHCMQSCIIKRDISMILCVYQMHAGRHCLRRQREMYPCTSMHTRNSRMQCHRAQLLSMCFRATKPMPCTAAEQTRTACLSRSAAMMRVWAAISKASAATKQAFRGISRRRLRSRYEWLCRHEPVRHSPSVMLWPRIIEKCSFMWYERCQRII